MDIDWAPEPVIAHSLELFEHAEVPCTIFATHPSPVLATCNRRLFEIGIHPNFNALLAGSGGDPRQIVGDLLSAYPEATGWRSHSMTQSTPLLELCRDMGLIYEANQFLPYWPSIHPYLIWNGLVRIPYNWEDDVHFAYGRSFDDVGLDADAALNVLDFHPVHVYLNTDTRERYIQARPHYHDVPVLTTLRNTDRPGAGTLLARLLAESKQATTLRAIAQALSPARVS
jgi:hypothetical protein